ncbi:hypothetical protein RZS08_26220, partial [Arthrospira platensis SPKY1]|nr:hypothetical protein [Arthrospira platensis SPKY1]
RDYPRCKRSRRNRARSSGGPQCRLQREAELPLELARDRSANRLLQVEHLVVAGGLDEQENRLDRGCISDAVCRPDSWGEVARGFALVAGRHDEKSEGVGTLLCRGALLERAEYPRDGGARDVAE